MESAGGILQGTASLINSGVGLADYAFGTTSARSYSQQRRLQKHQFDFEREMFEKQVQLANTAHQREVQDLKDAGLNPVLSAGAQPGSDTPSAGPGSSGGQVASGPTGVDVANMMANTAKTISEMKNIDADTRNKEQQYGWTPQLNKALIEYQNAGSAKLRAEKENLIQNIAESQAKQKAIEIQNKMSEMDVDKREKYFSDEMELYKKQIQNQLIDAGFDQSAVGLILKSIDKTLSATHISMNAGTHSSNNTSNANVNVHKN